MPKPKIYSEIPEFDQYTQAVYQLSPVELDDCIFYGVEVIDMPPQEGENDEHM